jgi:hypothetical protein
MIAIWIFITILAVLAFFMVRLEHEGRKIKLVLVAVVIALLYFSIVGFVKSTNAEINSPKDVVSMFYMWFGWMGEKAVDLWGVGEDVVIGVGNVVKSNQTQEKTYDGRS